MGEKANEGARGRRLPAGGAVAIGAALGLVVASTLTLVVGGGDDDEDVVAAAETTTTVAAAPVATTAPVVLPEGPFEVVLVVDEVDLPIEADLFPSGQVFPGTTLSCGSDTCRLDLVFSTLVETIELVRDGDTLRGTFDYDVEEARCAGTGTGTGSGTVALTVVGDGYEGDVDFAAENPTLVERDGGQCIGGTFHLDLTATPSVLPEGPFDIVVTATSIEAPEGEPPGIPRDESSETSVFVNRSRMVNDFSCGGSTTRSSSSRYFARMRAAACDCP